MQEKKKLNENLTENVTSYKSPTINELFKLDEKLGIHEFGEKYKFMLENEESFNPDTLHEIEYESDSSLKEYEIRTNKTETLNYIIFGEKKTSNINNVNIDVNMKEQKPFFTTINKKLGRCPKKIGNKSAKHTNASYDDCYKKIVNKGIECCISDINEIIKVKFNRNVSKINKITGIEKGYNKDLLEKKIHDILIDYRKVKTNKIEKEENKDIIEKIKHDSDIYNIIETKFHYYIDDKMKSEIDKISDENEKKTWVKILENGILNFCINRKLRKKRNLTK